MGKYLCEDLQRQLDVRDRLDKIEVFFLSLCDDAISNYQEYNKLSGADIDMYLKRIQDAKDLFDRIKKTMIEYSSDRNLEDLLYLGIEECLIRINWDLDVSKNYLEKVKKQGV